MRHLTALIVAALALSIASCGGEGDGGGGGADSAPATQRSAGLPKDEFIEKADEACDRFDEAEDEADEEFRAAAAPEDQADLMREVADAADKTAGEIEALGPPSEGADLIEDYVAKTREQVLLLRRAADELESGNQTGAEAIIESARDQTAELRGIARGYGFRDCGNDD